MWRHRISRVLKFKCTQPCGGGGGGGGGGHDEAWHMPRHNLPCKWHGTALPWRYRGRAEHRGTPTANRPPGGRRDRHTAAPGGAGAKAAAPGRGNMLPTPHTAPAKEHVARVKSALTMHFGHFIAHWADLARATCPLLAAPFFASSIFLTCFCKGAAGPQSTRRVPKHEQGAIGSVPLWRAGAGRPV